MSSIREVVIQYVSEQTKVNAVRVNIGGMLERIARSGVYEGDDATSELEMHIVILDLIRLGVLIPDFVVRGLTAAYYLAPDALARLQTVQDNPS